jgi:hypothetical protein
VREAIGDGALRIDGEPVAVVLARLEAAAKRPSAQMGDDNTVIGDPPARMGSGNTITAPGPERRRAS